MPQCALLLYFEIRYVSLTEDVPLNGAPWLCQPTPASMTP